MFSPIVLLRKRFHLDSRTNSTTNEQILKRVEAAAFVELTENEHENRWYLKKTRFVDRNRRKPVVVAGYLSDSEQSTETTDKESQSSHISNDAAHMNVNGWRTSQHHISLIVPERGSDVTSTNDELQPNLQLCGARTRRSLTTENGGPLNPNVNHNTRYQ